MWIEWLSDQFQLIGFNPHASTVLFENTKIFFKKTVDGIENKTDGISLSEFFNFMIILQACANYQITVLRKVRPDHFWNNWTVHLNREG